MKILFIGDYSNLHACLAAELRRRGNTVTVMSDRGGYMHTHSDIFIEREPGPIGGAKYLYKLFNILPKLKGYDVVQLINPTFLSLRPGKIKYFFDFIKGENNSVHLTLAGNDYFFVKACADAELFRFSEFKVGKSGTEFLDSNPEFMYDWISASNRRWCEYLYEKIDGAISVLPEYDMAARPILGKRLTFTNLPVDLSTLPFSPLTVDGPLRLFIGMKGGMEVRKGTARLLQMAKDLERDLPGKVIAECVRNLPLAEYLQRMRQAHIVLDQLYSYSPATNALQAMAFGKVAASGGQPEYYEYIGNPAARPVFSLEPTADNRNPVGEETVCRLRELAADPSPLFEMSKEGRKLVERNNDVKTVADRCLAHWRNANP